MADKLTKADKGLMGGSCNRTDCQEPGATWFNTSTRRYYCQPCAMDISGFAKRVDGFHICFRSTGDAEQDAAMKFKSEYPEAGRSALKAHAEGAGE